MAPTVGVMEQGVRGGGFRRASAARAVGFLSLLLLSGCLSTHPGSSSLAYVDIVSHDTAAVSAATVRVFEDNGYALVGASSPPWVFEREGTQRDRVMYGRYGDKRLDMRVVVTIEPRRQGGCLLRADAYVLRDGVEDPVPRVARRPYRSLLNQVQASLETAERGE